MPVWQNSSSTWPGRSAEPGGRNNNNTSLYFCILLIHVWKSIWSVSNTQHRAPQFYKNTQFNDAGLPQSAHSQCSSSMLSAETYDLQYVANELFSAQNDSHSGHNCIGIPGACECVCVWGGVGDCLWICTSIWALMRVSSCHLCVQQRLYWHTGKTKRREKTTHQEEKKKSRTDLPFCSESL